MQNHDRRSHARPAPLPDSPDAIRADLDALVAGCADISTGSVPANDTPSALHRGVRWLRESGQGG